MEFFHRFLYHPRRIWIRRVNFQIHLWCGIILSLYMIVMGVTGSVLVFQGELETLCGLIPWHSIRPIKPYAPLSTVTRNLRIAYPTAHIGSLMIPTDREPTFSAVLVDRAQIRIALHPDTGELLGPVPATRNWLDYVEQLHVSLLVPRNGRIPNGIGAAFLLLMAGTGLVNWWPGIRNWSRRLKLDFRRSWRRINFDLHSAVGFWMLAMIAMWAASGIYFAWPRQIFRFVNRISPIVSAKPPVVTVTPESAPAEPDLDRLVEQASTIDPAAEFRGIVFPFSHRAPMEIVMRRGHGAGRIYEDTLYFNPYTGAYLTTWHYGVNQSFGDWFIWLQAPLHFGIYWGLGVKILWALCGLSIPTLAVTGLLMYWNRALRKSWPKRSKIREQPQFRPA
jgi:uncharacterized iron-regulated membrane protein